MANFRYSVEQLRNLRPAQCICLNRKTTRRLKFFRVFVRHITVRVSTPSVPLISSKNRDHGNLVTIQLSKPEKKRYPRRQSPRPPSLFLTNIRSLSPKHDEVSIVLQRLLPDIAILTESWLNPMIPTTSIDLPNYQTIRRDRLGPGGGIVCYIANSFCSQQVFIIDENAVSSLGNCKSEILSMILPNLLLIAIYHPFWNNPTEHKDCITCITDIIDYAFSSHLNECSGKIVLCGDFNDLRLYSDDIQRLTGAKAIVDFPTRCQHTLDQIFTNITSANEPQHLPPIANSDHACVLWKPCSAGSLNGLKKMVRKFTAANRERFARLMHSINWEDLVLSSPSVDESTLLFQTTISYLYDLCFPFRTIRFRVSDPPWINATLKILINDRDRAYSQGKQQKYLSLRRKAINYIQWLKMNYVKNAVLSLNSRKVWSAIRTTGRYNHACKQGFEFTADELSRYFASTFNDAVTESSLTILSNDLPDCPLTLHVSEVEGLMMRIKKKSAGPDNIPHWVLKDYCKLLSPSVTILFNNILRDRKVPACFKDALISPIPKRARPSEPSHFRPISLLPILSKILEKIVAKYWIRPHISSTIRKDQFAYAPGPGKGTSCALTLINHLILQFLDSKSGAVRVLTTDFTKAFDKLPHQVIIDASYQLRLPSQAIDWIKSFLSGRRQCVRVGLQLSDWSNVPSGVPQGSIVGPLLFCMVFNSYSSICTNSRVIKYADDMTLLHFVRCDEEDFLQTEWDNITMWSRKAGLSLNISKCAVMDIVKKKDINLRPVCDESNVCVPSKTVITLLGVKFSSDLKWNSHFDHIVSKTSMRLFLLRNLKKFNCSSEIIFKAYAGFIRSLLLYCCPVFSNAPGYLWKKLESVERRAIKIAGSKSYPDLHSVITRISKRLFSQIRQEPSHPLRELFRERNLTSTRNSCPLRPPFASTERFRKSFIFYCDR